MQSVAMFHLHNAARGEDAAAAPPSSPARIDVSITALAVTASLGIAPLIAEKFFGHLTRSAQPTCEGGGTSMSALRDFLTRDTPPMSPPCGSSRRSTAVTLLRAMHRWCVYDARTVADCLAALASPSVLADRSEEPWTEIALWAMELRALRDDDSPLAGDVSCPADVALRDFIASRLATAAPCDETGWRALVQRLWGDDDPQLASEHGGAARGLWMDFPATSAATLFGESLRQSEGGRLTCRGPPGGGLPLASSVALRVLACRRPLEAWSAACRLTAHFSELFATRGCLRSSTSLITLIDALRLQGVALSNHTDVGGSMELPPHFETLRRVREQLDATPSFPPRSSRGVELTLSPQ